MGAQLPGQPLTADRSAQFTVPNTTKGRSERALARVSCSALLGGERLVRWQALARRLESMVRVGGSNTLNPSGVGEEQAESAAVALRSRLRIDEEGRHPRHDPRGTATAGDPKWAV
jgi:hypothetical protein